MIYVWFVAVGIAKLTSAVTLESLPMHIGTALISVTYTDPLSVHVVNDTTGYYGLHSPLDTKHGKLIHVRTADNKTHACSPPVNVPTSDSEPWIALVRRGDCKFVDKINNTARLHKASALVVYDHEESEEILLMTHNVSDIVTVWISYKQGAKLADLVDHNIQVEVNISLGGFKSLVYNDVTESTDVPHAHIDGRMVAISLCLVGVLLVGVVLLFVYIVRRGRHTSTANNRQPAPHVMNVFAQNPGDRRTMSMSTLCASRPPAGYNQLQS